MGKIIRNPVVFGIAKLCMALALSAQGNLLGIDRSTKKRIVDSAAASLSNSYVFPEVAKQMIDQIIKNLNQGTYDAIQDPQEFAARLTQDLRAVSQDSHVGVEYSPGSTAASAAQVESRKNGKEYVYRFERMRNFGFKEVKILPGNIGYLKLDEFDRSREGFEVAVNALGFVAHCDALIIDVRENGGGYGDMMTFFCSYLFGPPIRQLSSIYQRDIDKTYQFWTQSYIPGTVLANIDLYVLTSGQTCSGAEWLAYDLKNLKRATIVGETTYGAAHITKIVNIDDHYMIYVPFGRLISPITGRDWEGTGVEPDVKVPANEALDKAQILALEKMIRKETDGEVSRRVYGWRLEELKGKARAVVIPETVLKSYVGRYGHWHITLENGYLYYQMESGQKKKMESISEDYFSVEGINYFRLRIVKRGRQPIGIEGIYNDGRIDFNPK